jgi:ABC-type uncharacterized transport system involved in gliding motility auxiliary subunit
MQELTKHKVRFGAFSLTYVLVVIAVLAALNYLAQQYNRSYDATSEKRFTLADQTTQLVSGLKEKVTLYYFGSKTRGFNSARDLLGKYDQLSSNLDVRYVDVEEDPQLALRFNVGTVGTVVAAAGVKSEEASLLSEEEVTGALVRLLKGKPRVLCVHQGFGENSFEDASEPSGFGAVKDLLKQNNYESKTISLLENPQIPADCRILLFPGPRREVPQSAVDTVKTYVEQGGRLIAFLPAPLQLKQETVSPNEPFTRLIDSWGVTVNRDLVIGRTLQGFSPLAPISADFQPHPITRPFQGRRTAVITPQSRSLTVKPNSAAQPLFATLLQSFSTTKLDAAEIDLTLSGPTAGAKTIAAAGTFDTGKKEAQGRFVVVGSGDWINNGMPPSIANFNMFLNMINWLSQDEDLISIRPKDPQDRRLNMTEGQTTLVLVASVLFLPLMAILAGVSAWWRRR